MAFWRRAVGSSALAWAMRRGRHCCPTSDGGAATVCEQSPTGASVSLRALTGPYCCQLSLPPSLSKLQAPIAARRLIWLPSSQPSRPALQSLISVVSSIRPSIHSWIRCCALFLARISRPCAGAESNRIVSWARKVTDQWVSVATLGLQALPQSGPSTRPPPPSPLFPRSFPAFNPHRQNPALFHHRFLFCAFLESFNQVSCASTSPCSPLTRLLLGLGSV